MALANPRANLDPASSGQFVEVERRIAVEHAKVNGISGLFRQLLQVLPRDTWQIELIAGCITEFEQLRARHIPFARYQSQISTPHERLRQAMNRTSIQLEVGGKLRER
jgi:hypothetical protein